MGASRLVRALLATFAAAAALLLVVPAANAADYPGGATLTVNDPAPVCGTTVDITGTGFLPSTTVTLTIGGTVIGTATTNAQGSFTFPYKTSCTQVGSLVISASDGTTVLSVTLSVSGAGTTPATSTGTAPLPRTGSDSGLYVRAGVLLIAAGGLLVLATRKRSGKTADIDA